MHCVGGAQEGRLEEQSCEMAETSGSRAGGRWSNTGRSPADRGCLWGNLGSTVTTYGTELNLNGI